MTNKDLHYSGQILNSAMTTNNANSGLSLPVSTRSSLRPGLAGAGLVDDDWLKTKFLWRCRRPRRRRRTS